MAVNNLYTKAKVNLVKPEENMKPDLDFQDNDTKALLTKLNKINGKLTEFKYVTEKFISGKGGTQVANDKKFYTLMANIKGNAHIIKQMIEDTNRVSKNS